MFAQFMISQNKGKQKDDSPPKRSRYTRESSLFPSRDKWYSSHHNDDFYQSPPKRPYRPRKHYPREPRIDLPPFYRKLNIE